MEVIVNIFSILGGIGSIIALPVFIWQLNCYRKDERLAVSSKVSARFENDGLGSSPIIIYNNSEMPIYDVIVSIDLYSTTTNEVSKGNEDCYYLSCIAPGRTKLLVPYRGGGSHMRFGASITFRDNRGVYWTRFANGHLIEHEKKYHLGKRVQINSFEFREIVTPCEEAFGLIVEPKISQSF